MMYKEISLLLKKIGIDLEKIKMKKDDVVDFSDITLEGEMPGENSEKEISHKGDLEFTIYNDEETLENIYYKLKSIYGDTRHIIKQEAILENNIKKVYRYVPISKIDIMVTNHSRNDKIRDKFKDALPIIEYIYFKEFKDFDKIRLEYLLKDYDNEKYDEIEKLQKELFEKEPFKITYEEDVFYEIYYLKEENRYVLMICTEDIVFKQIQYILQKKVEYYLSKNEQYIYTGISNLEYSENFLYKEEIQELEDILWYFTKSWPITYELYNNEGEYSLEIVGNIEIYNGLTSIYRIKLKNKEKAAEYLKLAKALMTLEKDTNKYLKFTPIISEKEGLKFRYSGNDIVLKDIPDFLIINYVKLYEETMAYIDENMSKKLKLEILTGEKAKKEEKLNDLQNYITSFLDSKRTFFGKFRYFFGKDPLKQLEQKEQQEEREKKEQRDKKEKNKEELSKIEEERKEIEELKEKINLKRDFCTIEEYIFLYKEYEKQNKKLKFYLRDISVLEHIIENLDRNIRNGMEYIKEISIEKKSLIGFFKYTNKDKKDVIAKAESEFKEEKMHKIFNYDLDFLKFAEDMDKEIRKSLDNNEISSVYLAINGMLKYMNKFREYQKNDDNDVNMKEYYQELELYLKDLKNKYVKIYGENAVDYDIFGNSQNFKQTRYLGEKAFREEDRELYKEMKFKKNMVLDDLINIIKENLAKLEDAIDKTVVDMELDVYKIVNWTAKLKENNIEIYNFNINEEKINIGKEDKTYNLYHLNIPNEANMVPLTNITFYTNNNKTLPLGMDVSTQVLLDMSKFNFVVSEYISTKINVVEGIYSNIKNLNIYRYRSYLKK